MESGGAGVTERWIEGRGGERGGNGKMDREMDA